MTRIPAPADDADLDLALREAAEQWRMGFQVPPMPLLDNDSQRRGSQPLETRAPARLRWTRPVLVAASIIVAAVVISSARPTDQVAGPSVSAGPSDSAGTSPSPGPATSLQVPVPDPVWPVPGMQTLDILDGTPPASFTKGGTVFTLSRVEAPSNVIIDSQHPTFLSVSGSNDVGSSCGFATRVYLQREGNGVITIATAIYGFSSGYMCGGPAKIALSIYGSAPYPVADRELVWGDSRTPIESVDLADFRAPRYLPSGYELGVSVEVSTGRTGRPQGAQVYRSLTADGHPLLPDIRLTWQDPRLHDTAAPEPSRSTPVIRCATRVLRTDLAVTACSSAIDPQRPVTVAELQRVVDSIQS